MVALSDIKSLKVPELKNELKALGLDVKGVKADLVKRLEDALSTSTAEGAGGPAPSSAVVANSVPEDEGAGQALSANGRTPIHFKPTTAKAETEKVPAAENTEAHKIPEKVGGGANEAEKRRQRAQRFGVEPSAADKLKARAERFGTADAANGQASKVGISTLTESDKVAEAKKKEERAKRFNIQTSQSDAAKKKARLERFGVLSGTASTPSGTTQQTQEKLEARAKRFAADEPPTSASKPAADSEAEAKRQARAIRFAAT